MKLSEETGLFPSEHLESLREMLNEFFEAGDGQRRFWLTDDSAGAVGVVYCEPEVMTSGTWNLRLIAVAPPLQGKGRGGRLLEHVEEHLRTKNARLLIVDTSGTDEFASVRSFYTKHGYKEESRIRNFFEEGDDKVTFTKQLT
ncbi:MAG: GNAT family N-acetyltransferase [Opitutales bacterium]